MPVHIEEHILNEIVRGVRREAGREYAVNRAAEAPIALAECVLIVARRARTRDGTSPRSDGTESVRVRIHTSTTLVAVRRT